MAGLSAAVQWLDNTGFDSQVVDFTANYFGSLTFWRKEIGTKQFCGSEASVCFLAWQPCCSSPGKLISWLVPLQQQPE